MLSEYAKIVELSKLPRKKKELMYYLVGFADAEGCFNISLKSLKTARFNWVLDPVFHVTQHESNRPILELLKAVLKCGRVIEKPGQKGTLQFMVDNRKQLIEKIIPFFDRYPLIVKGRDYEIFREIVTALENKEHSDIKRFEKLVERAFKMNLEGKQRRYKLSEVLKDLERQDPQRLYARHSKG